MRRKQGPSNIKCALLNFPVFAILTGLGDPACDAYIKRVVAIGGDQVLINEKGELVLNGVWSSEPYVSKFCNVNQVGMSACRPLKTEIPSDHVLVLGDNRRNSWDARYWPGGPFLPEKEILGRAIWRFWPLNRLGILGS